MAVDTSPDVATDVACTRTGSASGGTSRSSSNDSARPLSSTGTPIGSVSMSSRISSIDVLEKSLRHHPASAYRFGSTPSAVGGSVKLASVKLGSVRTIAIVSGGIDSEAASTWSGGEALTLQSAPTCTWAASLWFCSTIARYDVASTSSPIESSSSSAAANPVPGERPSRRPAR